MHIILLLYYTKIKKKVQFMSYCHIQSREIAHYNV